MTTPTLNARFWSKVEKTPTCWNWTAALKDTGYGVIGKGRRGEGAIRAHVFAYQSLIGPIPKGEELHHLCGNKGCVNPNHLMPVTRKEHVRLDYNIMGMKANQTACLKGHPLEGDNLYTYMDSEGRTHRLCRLCAARRRRIRTLNGR